jgi:hypothetical protein
MNSTSIDLLCSIENEKKDEMAGGKYDGKEE